MTQQLKNKLNTNAKHLRFISRAEMFQRNRKPQEELDYLSYYPLETRELIIHSLRAPIPQPLPPLAPETISFYRRSRTPIFRTKTGQNQVLDAHLTYESLWILSGLQEKQYDNFQLISKEFERDLPLFLGANSSDIREMATIAAGNKILGKQKDILALVQRDPRQLWVLANHIYEKKISYRKIMPFLQMEHIVAFQTMYELSNGRQEGAAEDMAADSNALNSLIAGLKSTNPEIKKYSIRILGNIAAEKQQHLEILHGLQLLDRLVQPLETTIVQMRRDICWLVSNLVCEKTSANLLINHKVLMTKLVQLFSYETNLEIKRELTLSFSSLAYYGDKAKTYQLLAHHKLLQICYHQLCTDETELSLATLFLLNKLIDLGDNFRIEEQENIFCLMIAAMGDLRSEIQKKSYSENNQISGLSIDIMNHLEDDE